MSDQSERLWIGPVTAFIGISIFIAGGLWRSFLSQSSDYAWMQYASGAMLIIGGVLLFNGVSRIIGDTNNK